MSDDRSSLFKNRAYDRQIKDYTSIYCCNAFILAYILEYCIMCVIFNVNTIYKEFK